MAKDMADIDRVRMAYPEVSWFGEWMDYDNFLDLSAHIGERQLHVIVIPKEVVATEGLMRAAGLAVKAMRHKGNYPAA